MGFPRLEYWSGLPCPPPGDLPDPGVKPASPASPALGGGFFTTEPPGRPPPLGGLLASQLSSGPYPHARAVRLLYGSKMQSYRWTAICVTVHFVTEDYKKNRKKHCLHLLWALCLHPLTATALSSASVSLFLSGGQVHLRAVGTLTSRARHTASSQSPSH